MALLLSGSTQYVSQSPILTAYPITFACWFKANSLAASYILMSTGDATDANQLAILGNTSGTFKAQTRINSVSAGPTTAASITTGGWHLICAVWASATSRTIYLDGGNSVNDTTTQTLSWTPTSTRVGADNTGAGDANGTVAYPAIWNIALSSTDVSNLYNFGQGIDPRKIQAASIQSFTLFTPGSVSPWLDSITQANWTTTGSPVTAADPFSLATGIGGSLLSAYNFWGGGFS